MDRILEAGQRLHVDGAELECRVDEFIGAGDYGEVYRALLGDRPVAVKWLFPTFATSQRYDTIQTLIKKERPSLHFVWPEVLVASDDTAGFGYVMPLREAAYRRCTDFLQRRVRSSLHALITAGRELANGITCLHAREFLYPDLSLSNVFIEPVNGDALLCGIDAIAVDNAIAEGVLGTLRFMAPEIMRGDAGPSTHTDLFSLAVVLFYLLMNHHPLEGKKEVDIRVFNEAAMDRLYGREPVFIFDPDDHSNEPLAGYHDNALALWPIYPRYMHDLFTRAFTVGLFEPARRPQAAEWQVVLQRMLDDLVYCAHCNAENVVDHSAPMVTRRQSKPCWSCHQDL